jgi:hypothetical protein
VSVSNLNPPPPPTTGDRKEWDIYRDKWCDYCNTWPGSHATARFCASKQGRLAPCTLNSRRRPSGKSGCALATLAQSSSTGSLLTWDFYSIQSNQPGFSWNDEFRCHEPSEYEQGCGIS